MRNTRFLMTSSAVMMGAIGIFLSFIPGEVGAFFGWQTQEIVLQLLGALYFSFGMVNWTAKASLIGGIYGRAVSIGNFTHFMIASLVLIKFSVKAPEPGMILMALLYSLFALLFGIVFFTHPLKKA